MSTQVKVKIAVTGHTNTGKTTLIRTLTKSDFGIVANRANSTTVAETVKLKDMEHDSLYATFIDCPGFTQASKFIQYLNLVEENSSPEEFEKYMRVLKLNEETLKYDKAAYNGVEGSDVALYVVDLESVPEEHHADEIEIVRKKQINIIGIINKSRLGEDSKKNTTLQERVALWENFFRDEKISHHIVFDAFWDKPSKVKKIYEFIKYFLQTDKLNSFLEGLKKFNQRQKEITEKVSYKLADCIIECRKLEKNFSRIEDKKEDKNKQDFIENMAKIIQKFIVETTEVFEFSENNPFKSISEDDLKFQEFTSKSDVIKGLTTGASVGASLGAGLGAALAGTIAFLTVGLTAGAVVPFAVAVGSAIAGGGGGITGIVSMWNQNVSISLSKDALTNIAMICLACLWELSYHGYGNKPEDANKPKIEESEIKQLTSTVEAYWKKTSADLDFSKAERSKISKWCVRFFEELDNGTL